MSGRRAAVTGAAAVGVAAVVAVLALGAGRAAVWQHGQWSPMQPFTSAAGDTIHYYLFTPKAAGPAAKLPLVVWLHGGLASNGVGGPNVVRDAFYRDEHQQAHPCFVLRPVAIKGRNWVSPRGAGTGSHAMPADPSPSMKAAMELIERVLAEQPADPARLYVVGASMGGYGVWDLAARWPDRLAAAVPICGGGDPAKAPLLKGLPTWIFHGDRDPTVPVAASREMFEALAKARGQTPIVVEAQDKVVRTSPDGRLRYTEYKGGDHNAAWDQGLEDPSLLAWLFGQARK